MKKTILVSIRFGSDDKDIVAKIKEYDPSFNLSLFVRNSLRKKLREQKRTANKNEDETRKSNTDQADIESEKKFSNTASEVTSKTAEPITNGQQGKSDDLENLF